jgi:hypothetical protein
MKIEMYGKVAPVAELPILPDETSPEKTLNYEENLG